MFDLNTYPLWTASITPMTASGSIDLDDLERLARDQEAAGNGLLILGSTGEGLALTLREKKDVVRFVAGLGLSVPVMVGVGGFNLAEQLDWIAYCNTQRIDAFLLVTPLYAKPGLEGQVHWFLNLMNRADHPCMLYNVPSRTGVALQPMAVQRLQDHPRLLGVKEASGSIARFQEFRLMCPGVRFYSGDDGLLPYFAQAGAAGLVSVVSNAWPAPARRYVDLALSGRCGELFPVWKEACEALFIASNPIPAKVLLRHQSRISTSVLRPPLTDRDLTAIDPLLAADEAVRLWMETQTRPVVEAVDQNP